MSEKVQKTKPTEDVSGEKKYLVAGKDLKAGETVLSDHPFILGPKSDSALVCFQCYQPLISKFLTCKNCGVAPVCPETGCPEQLMKWHTQFECDLFKTLKQTKGLNPMTMVNNVGSLMALRTLLKKDQDPKAWEEFLKLETHLEERRNTIIWGHYEDTVMFIDSLGLLEGVEDKDLVQKICAAIDVNSFEVRGPTLPAIGCSEVLRGVYLKAALLPHDCVANIHASINDNNLLIFHASTDIKKGDTIYYNYTDPLKGTTLRRRHLKIGKYFSCSCRRCVDPTELGTYMSSALCPACKTGYMSQSPANPEGKWTCNTCKQEKENSEIGHKVQCCADKFAVINKKDDKELEEYIKNVSLVLAPNHYLLIDAKQRLAGLLRDIINREPHPTKKIMRRKIELCREILSMLEKLTPGICRTKAITLYELHATIVQLSKKLFDAREISGNVYMDELLSAEKYLKRSLEMLFIEPGNSPEGELCAKALEEYRALKTAIGTVLDGLHAEGKTYVSATQDEDCKTEPTVN